MNFRLLAVAVTLAANAAWADPDPATAGLQRTDRIVRLADPVIANQTIGIDFKDSPTLTRQVQSILAGAGYTVAQDPETAAVRLTVVGGYSVRMTGRKDAGGSSAR
ncbi:MAG: hypothetical protein IPG34_16405 [Rhodocyclaceae bacterium]|nr:hypothetical protein [Rhodocyclaceae bacterium]